MKTYYLSQTVAAIFCLTSLCAIAKDEVKATLVKPYVTVNGMVQPVTLAELLLREQMARGAPDSNELRNGVHDTLINLALMEQQARSVGLDKDALVQAQVELVRQNILAQAWQQKILSETPITDAELQSEYAVQVARLGDKEVLIRHVLVSDESTAKLLIEKLQAGSKIADLAKEYSRDASTQNRGGLADWALPVNIQSPVAEAVLKLVKGKFTLQPVRSELGWHILQLEDTRPFKSPSLTELKPQLSQIIARRTIDARLKALRDKAKVS